MICLKQQGTTQKSTMSQIILYISEVCDQLDSQTHAYFAFEKDLTKVHHKKLPEKLRNCRVTKFFTDLLQSYLISWSHRVKVENFILSDLDVRVEQQKGHCSELFFFKIFIIDLPGHVISKCFGYADD